MTTRLSDYIRDPDTRAFIGRVYRAWGVEWAAEITKAIHEGVLFDMGDFYPYSKHKGRNKANGACPICGEPKLESETAWKYVSRWKERETEQVQDNPKQMVLGAKVQLKMEV